jgi:cell fate regulator YaaT (PSP1 superfamily)
MGKIRIPSTGQIFAVETDLKLESGEEVLAEVDGILEPAVFCGGGCQKEVASSSSVRVLKVLSQEDIEFKQKQHEKARTYVNEARSKAFRHGLDLKILDADFSFDEKKLTFYFSADGRVDFRSLVADMVGSFNRIIRLQQIGPRDEMKLYGGFGKCGRELCCAKFLSNLDGVSLELVENQELAGGKSPKFAGCCGKLMCCLAFENNSPKEIKKEVSKADTEEKEVSK